MKIGEAVYFVEQFYRTTVEAIYHKSAGMIVYRLISGEPEYLVLFQHRSQTWSFPKGHMDAFEMEEQTARREVREKSDLTLPLSRISARKSHIPLTVLRKRRPSSWRW
jgi:8-oxo-dGTP pyrophosphatase MutT (NUDIX family)